MHSTIHTPMNTHTCSLSFSITHTHGKIRTRTHTHAHAASSWQHCRQTNRVEADELLWQPQNKTVIEGWGLVTIKLPLLRHDRLSTWLSHNSLAWKTSIFNLPPWVEQRNWLLQRIQTACLLVASHKNGSGRGGGFNDVLDTLLKLHRLRHSLDISGLMQNIIHVLFQKLSWIRNESLSDSIYIHYTSCSTSSVDRVGHICHVRADSRSKLKH